MDIKDKRVLVVGLARTGVAVARFLAARGARIIITDMKTETELAADLEQLADLEIDYQLGRHEKQLFLMADLIVVSPGVPMDIKPLLLAKAQGRTVISEIELAAAYIDAPLVAITGTNGKTTTTTVTGKIFDDGGFRTFVGGNIGNPLIELVTSGHQVERVVVELSSFQLEGIKTFKPKVAVLLNITEDHLDRYASYQEYIDAKLRIFANQNEDDFAVLNLDDPLVAACAEKLKARVFPTSQHQEFQEGIFCRGGFIVYRRAGREERFDTAAFKLRGVHNMDNIMAALASTLLLGADADRARSAVENFTGLPHRMEFVSQVNGVDYYEDSKGTNVGSVVKSLESFDAGITLIAGGKDKGGEYAPLAPLIRERVRHMILIGEAKERINAELGALTDTHLATTLEEAVALAHHLATPGEVVLFSPACSSFDMFKNYADRGEQFKALVRSLNGGDGQ